ncbi:MAG: LemA family protein [Candidatus Pacebacteria bacterium]|nr:LemA family protein [Candidatus Paceibacterota bacterium]MCD8508409.1 LemA family protein [Candidatus Paceibacterota bacterium]MCD8527930.1 LemA family protein [Candidatus Paceibacterota bacterium]MCD8563724.1 LemA family protein [Candidatus Paceibacterota bacterium]
MIGLWIILGIAALILIWAIATYNRFIILKTRAEEAWADIDVQLKRRYDLIPNIIETVKGYAAHEKGVLEEVTKARTAAMAAEQSGDPARAAQAENALSGTLKTLFAVAENYPDLKANANFLELQRELSDTENKIQSARRFYNTNVRDFNIKTKTFPSTVIAHLFHFDKQEFFTLADAPQERENISVRF